MTVSINKWGGSYNTIDDLNAGVCVPNKAKKMNVKVFNLMSRVNETKSLVQYKLCEFKCGLNESECHSRQNWNHDESWCDCKELDDWRSCKISYMQNPRTCDCECKIMVCKINRY